uniref:4Fe-4S ferredoxin n=1 Tax=Trepomonas sp. PC1 TaxID=1076344 RepID=A0A146KN91_9EUKA|eukprot:JAP96519.1 4Fe-4S ferredoxin [Trepomonas sp. PC1]
MPVLVDVDKCVGCGACEGVCPNHALQIIDGKSKLVGNCDEHEECIGACPVQALSIV